MKAQDLIKIAAKESIMTLVFMKKDGSFRRVVASRCKMMYDKASADSGHVWAHEGTPSGCFSYVDVVENKWKRLIIANLVAVKRADGSVFYTNKRALARAERAVGKL